MSTYLPLGGDFRLCYYGDRTLCLMQTAYNLISCVSLPAGFPMPDMQNFPSLKPKRLTPFTGNCHPTYTFSP